MIQARVWRAGLLVAVLSGCGDQLPGPPDTSPPSDTPAAGGVSGTVTDSHAVAIEGAVVCVVAHAGIPCGTTNAAGAYSLQLPELPGADLAVQVTATGFLTVVSLVEQPGSGTLWPSSLSMLSRSDAVTLLNGDAGFAFPAPGKGFVELRVNGATAGSLTGATATLAGGTAPVYLDASGVPDPALTGTTASGGVLFGGLTPGPFAITVTAAGKTCTAAPAGALIAGDWPGANGATAGGIAIGDAFTDSLSVLCN
jgi:hypothetical protein